MRIRRVRAAASPEVRAALASGQISLYRADEISKLPRDQQQTVVAQWTDRSLCRSQGQAIAARVIREALRRRAKVDLDKIAAAIRDAIALTNTPSPNRTFVKTRVF
jgi:hypothetical protein